MRFFILLICISCSILLNGQTSERANSGEIYRGLEKLNFLGSALYFAAHPDDENTRLISYLSNGVHANTAYLSLTRGDGGQNLIGTEIREELGVLRTHELLEARSIDGGKQYFSRANDFGYSKHPDETMEIWEEDEVLSDAVWVIRNFQPDVIINRFDHRTPGKTHGHHTASAMIALDAFEKANDRSAFPEQLKWVEPWETKRVYFNTSWWFYPGKNSEEKKKNFEAADTDHFPRVDVGEFDPVLGSSYSEIAIRSRSKHLSQGFGAIPWRGSNMEYLEPIMGSKPDDNTDIFSGINTTWSRVEGGNRIGEMVQSAIDNYDFTEPENTLETLLEIRAAILSLSDGYWKSVKLEEVDALIEAASGLFVEFIASEQRIAPGDSLHIEVELTNRSSDEISLESMSIAGLDWNMNASQKLASNEANEFEYHFVLPKATDYTAPYWLIEPGSLGMYKVDDQTLRGEPVTPHPLKAEVNLLIDGQKVTIEKIVQHKYRDPAVGEVYRPFDISPPVFASLDKDIYIISNLDEQEVVVEVEAGKDAVSGSVKLLSPEGWTAQPASQNFDLELKGAKQSLTFMVKPSKKAKPAEISVEVHLGTKVYDRSLTEIEYDHVPFLTVLRPASAKLARVPLTKGVNSVGYIKGAGDKLPENLMAVGYNVDVMTLEEATPERLAEHDAVILGVRIWNVEKQMPLYAEKLFKYAEDGGTLITQYNTTWGLGDVKVAPYDLKLSRERVTDEFAKIEVLAPDHRVMHHPNKITEEDFDGWVQERGLYFPSEWGAEFTPIFSCQDKGAEPSKGGLLIAEHGEGYFVYTGYSWFRELPAGVPGAYRIFANIIALGQETK